MENNQGTITIKLELDTTDFEEKLHEVAERLSIDNTLSSYRIYTKEDYKRYLLSNSKAHYMKGIIEDFEKRWETISKGYNFIIGVGKEDKSMMVYSVEHFNDNVLGVEHIKDNRYTIEPQELSKLMKETLTKAIETLSLMTKDLMNRNKEV